MSCLSQTKTHRQKIDCIVSKCKFIQTCNWNKRCMEQGLQLCVTKKLKPDKNLKQKPSN